MHQNTSLQDDVIANLWSRSAPQELGEYNLKSINALAVRKFETD